MRVISGECKGRKLKTLPGMHTRPTSEKVKEAMFSILQFELEGRAVLDLFAGTGQLGIEALSRGAAKCVFIENDRSAMEIVRANIAACKLEDRAVAVMSDYDSYLKRTADKFDIILVDPPYAAGCIDKLLRRVSEFDTLNLNGIIVIESEADTVIRETYKLSRGKEYFYGRTKLSVFHNSQLSIKIN